MRTVAKRCEISTPVLPALGSLKRWNTSNSARIDLPDGDVLGRAQW